MTFYNHIESVRGIAIDLTNGKKWRGASDKAAVFDALDAARREYMRLSDENAKLREQVTQLQSDWESERDYADQMAAKEKKVVAENAKLRELIRMMWKPFCWAQSSYDVCLTDEQDRAIRDMVRELGVDVD